MDKSTITDFDLVKLCRYITDAVKPVNKINKDMSNAKLLPTPVTANLVDCVCFCHLLGIHHCCLCSSGRYNLSPTTHPPPPLTLVYVPLMILQLP